MGTSEIYTFKIHLKGSKPSIWRRIEVPGTYTFRDLHCAIIDAMGWTGCHLYDFEIKDCDMNRVLVGRLEPEYGGLNGKIKEIDDTTLKISSYFKSPKAKAIYIYDFGDDWKHDVVLLSIKQAKPGVEYPRCVAGKRACPPEDCGGIRGYERLLKKAKDPNHEDYEETLKWLELNHGGELHPEEFDPKSVEFHDLDSLWWSLPPP